MDIANRRSEARFRTDGTADVRIVRHGRGEDIEARVCDISKSGLRIQINRLVLDGAEVTVTLNELLLSAEARHCSKIGSDLYEVGLKIIDVRAKSKFNLWRSGALGLGHMPHVASASAFRARTAANPDKRGFEAA